MHCKCQVPVINQGVSAVRGNGRATVSRGNNQIIYRDHFTEVRSTQTLCLNKDSLTN